MTSRRAAGFLFGLPIAFGLTMGPAFAEDGATSVPKTAVTPGSKDQSGGPPEDALRPSLGQDVVPAGGGAPGRRNHPVRASTRAPAGRRPSRRRTRPRR